MLELEHGFRVVDTHVVFEPDEARRPRGMGDAEQIEREMEQAGIVQSLIFPATRQGSYVKANNATARVAVNRPFRPIARINGARDPGQGATSRLRNLASSRSEEHTSPEDIEQYAYEDRFYGFALDPAEDGMPDEEVLGELSTAGLPVITYGGEGCPPGAIEDALLGYDFPVIIAHCGGYPSDEAMMDQAIGLLDSYENCFLDTSFVRLRDPLERALMEQPSQVVFGSGAPAVHPNVAVMEILTLDVPEDAMRKVFSKNAGRLFEVLAP
ncbi:amidohydrolase family protein [Halovenus sp. WSH3]|uniref:Amidohydrolase family protein n=1 Tax=Halovenus carboxidivorans TaxID=2692199 RepID=A0A6B0TAW8_9EURY|nr:amidohydrolase family protein [Halovenus carboxidivorans]MXR50319.1 amidohydrolase family protein [Halovenus carboxidivorans]